MLFFFKEKPIEIISYVASSYAFVNEFSPIVPAKEIYPEWLKKVPRSAFDWNILEPRNTVKSCPGIIKSITNGFIVPMWTDLALEYDLAGFKWAFADRRSSLERHGNESIPGYYTDYLILKIVSPWLLKSPVDLQLTFPFLYHPKPFPIHISPGVLPFDGADTGQINIFLFAERKEEGARVMIKQGTPLLHILPITERKVTIRHEVISTEEMIKKKSSTGANTHFFSKGIRNMAYNRKKNKT
jgi:hypothetical protein